MAPSGDRLAEARAFGRLDAFAGAVMEQRDRELTRTLERTKRLEAQNAELRERLRLEHERVVDLRGALVRRSARLAALERELPLEVIDGRGVDDVEL